MDHLTIHRFHRNSIGPPAISGQPLWNPNRSRHNNAWWETTTLIQKKNLPSPICTGMNKHQVCGQQTATTTHGEGVALATPCLHATVETVAFYPVLQESRRQKTRNPKLKTTAQWLCHLTVCSCNLCIFISWIFVSFYHMCSFQENCVNVFALCSRPYQYSWTVSGLTALASCILSFQTTVHYNVCLKHPVLGEHCTLYCNIVILLYHVQFFGFLDFIFSFSSHRIQSYFVSDVSLGRLPYARKVDL